MAIQVGPPLITLDLTIGQVENLNPQGQAESGINTGVTLNTANTGITLSSGGVIKGGQTAFNTGNGFFLGYSGSQYKVSIGDPSGDNITWDGADLSITANTGEVTGNLTVSGNLTVNGTTTTLNTATLDVEDKNITLNYGSGDTSSTANGAGITIQDAVNSSTNATILWNGTTDAFDFSNSVNITGDITASGEIEATEFIGAFRGPILFKAQAGEAITKGQVVYISGISGNTTVVSLADANNTAKMPAFGLAAGTANANASLEVYTFGTISSVNTSAFTVGDELFVSTTPGGLVSSAPTGSGSLIQKIGKVTRVHASAGSIKVMGAGRTNATPNLDNGDIFIGNSSNQAATQSLASAAQTAGALMDSEVTNLSQVKAFDSSDYATAAQGSTADSALQNVVEDTTPQLGGNLASNGNDILFADNDKAIFGAGSDLQIYHDGSNSYIKEGGTGNLLILANDFRIRNAAGNEDMLQVNQDGEVKLSYDGSTKLATTSTGINVTGTSLADTLETSTASGGLINVIRDDSTTGTNNSLGAIYWKSTEDSGTTVNIGAGILALADQNHSTIASGSRLSLQTTAVSATSPTERLRISAGGDISFYEDTGTTAKLFWDSSAERLGIGTASPAVPLQVSQGTNATATTIRIENTDTTITAAQTANAIEFYTNDSSTGGTGVTGKISHVAINAGSTYGLAFSAYNGSSLSEAMRIDSSGNLLVNGTNNTGKLVVDGDANAYTARFNSSTTTGQAFGARVRAGTNSSDFAVLVENTSASTMFAVRGDGNVITGSATANATDAVTLRQDGTAHVNNVQVANAAGSVGGTTPSLYSPASATLAISTGSTERMRIDSSGNFMVGTTEVDVGYTASGVGCMLAPEGTLQLARNSANELLYLNKLGGNDGDIIRLSTDGNEIGVIGVRANYIKIGNGDTHLLFNSAADAVTPEGLTANRDAAIDLGRSVSRFKDLYLSANCRATSFVGTDDNDTLVRMGGSNVMQFFTANSERARFDASGNLLVGTTNVNPAANNVTGHAFKAGGLVEHANSGAMAMRLNRTDSDGSIIEFRKGTGTVGSISVTGSATAYNTSSDQRLKDNIVDAPSASDDIDAIQVRSFDWKADGSHQKYGMVAQELNTVAPEAVSTPEDPEEMMGVDYSKLVPMLVKEIQSLRARVAQLETN